MWRLLKGIYRMLPVTSHVHCVPTLSWLDVTWKLTCVKSDCACAAVLKRWPLRLRREQVAIEIKTLSKTKAGAPSSGKHWLWHIISFYSHHPSFVLLLVVQFICLQRASHIVGSLEKVFSLFPVHQGWKPTVFGFSWFWTKSFCHCTPLFSTFIIRDSLSMMGMFWLMELYSDVHTPTSPISPKWIFFFFLMCRTRTLTIYSSTALFWLQFVFVSYCM